MKLNVLTKKEKLNQKHPDEQKENGLSYKAQPDNAVEVNAENNLCAKDSMVTELVEMGLSLDAIERILNLESEVLDRIL